MSKDRTCFVLEPYYARDNPHRPEFDTLFDMVIESAVDGQNYRIVRSSGLRRATFITREHHQLAQEADLMIANLTDSDPMVMFCLATRLTRQECLRSVPGRHDTGPARYWELPTLLLRDQATPNPLEVHGRWEPPVVYKLRDHENGAADEDNGQLSHEARSTLMSRDLLEARRDLTRLVELVVETERERDRPAAEAPHPVGASEGAEPEAAGGNDDLRDQVVDQVVRDWLDQKVNAQRQGSMVGDLTRTLFPDSKR